MSSITLGTLYEGLVTIKAGSNFFNFPSFFKNPTVNVAMLVVSTGDLMMFGISAVALIVLAYVIQKTRLGRALRAVSFDRDTAQLMGIDSTRIIQLAFVISGILAGIAGVFLGIKYTLYPHLGQPCRQGLYRLGHRRLGQPDRRRHRRAAAGDSGNPSAGCTGFRLFYHCRIRCYAGFPADSSPGHCRQQRSGKSVRRISHNECTCIQRTYAGFITLIAVSGIYVLTGLTGMFSLGQAAFMAIGSYVSGLLVIRAHVPFALAALLAVAGATLIGYVIGYPLSGCAVTISRWSRWASARRLPPC